MSETARRWAIFLMIIPFFTSYLVRVYSWQIFLADNGLINAVFGMVGIGPLGMLNSSFGTMVGYMTLNFSLVVMLQLFSLMFVERTQIEASNNMRCGRVRTLTESTEVHTDELKSLLDHS